MTLSLEMNMMVGAFVLKIAGAARKSPSGLAWKSVRGLRTWQTERGQAKFFVTNKKKASL